MVVLVWWCLQVGTEPGFEKEENDLRWNVHQLHFLWAGEWEWAFIVSNFLRPWQRRWISMNNLEWPYWAKKRDIHRKFPLTITMFLVLLKQEFDTAHFLHARSEKPVAIDTLINTRVSQNCKHTPFSYFLCNSPSKFQVCFIFYPPLGKPCQWLGEAKILWFSDRNLLRSTMGAMEIWSTHFWMKIM